MNRMVVDPFLSFAMRHQRADIPVITTDIVPRGRRKPPEMGGRAFSMARAKAAHRQAEGVCHAHRNGLAVQDRAVVSGLRFEGVGEGVAEVQQCPHAHRAHRRRRSPLLQGSFGAQPWAAGSPSITSPPNRSNHSKKSASPRKPYFTTSA